jgi:hypothetical protein
VALEVVDNLRDRQDRIATFSEMPDRDFCNLFGDVIENSFFSVQA